MGTLAAASSNRNRRKHQRHRIEEQQQQQRAHHPQLDTGIATEMPHASHPTGEQVAGQFHWLPWTVRFRTENALRLCVTTPTFPSNDGTEPLRFFVTTVIQWSLQFRTGKLCTISRKNLVGAQRVGQNEPQFVDFGKKLAWDRTEFTRKARTEFHAPL